MADLLSQDPGSPRKGHRTQESPRNGRGGEAGTTHFEDRKAHKLGWPLDAIGKKKTAFLLESSEGIRTTRHPDFRQL